MNCIILKILIASVSSGTGHWAASFDKAGVYEEPRQQTTPASCATQLITGREETFNCVGVRSNLSTSRQRRVIVEISYESVELSDPESLCDLALGNRPQ